jgi:hypothetical protein
MIIRRLYYNLKLLENKAIKDGNDISTIDYQRNIIPEVREFIVNNY